MSCAIASDIVAIRKGGFTRHLRLLRPFGQDFITFFQMIAARIGQGKGQDAMQQNNKSGKHQPRPHAKGKGQMLPLCFARRRRMFGKGTVREC